MDLAPWLAAAVLSYPHTSALTQTRSRGADQEAPRPAERARERGMRGDRTRSGPRQAVPGRSAHNL